MDTDAAVDTGIPVDSGNRDGGPDGGPRDTGVGDTGVGDTGASDTGIGDSGADAGPCVGLALCSTAGTTCSGNMLVTCAANADGCLVETPTDCTTTSQICSPTGGTGGVAACVDPCAHVPVADRCSAASRACTADTLDVCAMDAMGCFALTHTDCAAAAGGSCDDSGAMPVCISTADPCGGLTSCGTATTRSCVDGTHLNVCDANAAGCFIDMVSTCPAGTVCDASSGTAACVDPCTLVDVCPMATYCDMNAAVTCAPDANGCLVETSRSTCTIGPCSAGTCVDACAPATGNVIDCASGTITGDTAGGTQAIGGYDCASATLYTGHEVVYRFTNTQSAAVQIVSTRGSSTRDYDLFVLDGGNGTLACDDTSTCSDSSTGTGATETVDFNILPGEVRYVVFDLYNTPDTDTTSFTLDVTCVIPVCGDGAITGPETCDDSNSGSSDGCSSTCQIETGSVCYGLPSVCGLVNTCGNGFTEAGETCDDGNMGGSDGCSPSCQTEANFVCTTAHPSVCTALAANGSCATATAITGTTTLTAQDSRIGGAPFTGTGCDYSGNFGGTALYYAMTIPARTVVNVTTTNTVDFVLRAADSCGAGVCTTKSDEPESLSFANVTGAPITRILEINSYSSTSGAGGLTDVTFTYVTSVCGDGVTGTGETCDDIVGTPVDGDGCSASCQTELGYSCTGAPSVCVPAAPNSTCATATSITGTTTLTGQDTRIGGPPITGTGCQRGTANGGNGGNTLFYSVSIPARTVVNVTTSNSVDLVLRLEDSCSATSCSATADEPESISIPNATSSPITRVLAINSYGAQPAGGITGVTFTYVTSVCGNGMIEIGETCDDTNMVGTDGCSASCALETGYTCSGAPSYCRAFSAISAACVDLSAVTPIVRATGSIDDGASAVTPLPFSFSFFGAAQMSYSVTTNGFLQLYTGATGTPSTTFSNADIPASGTPNSYIAPFWDDVTNGVQRASVVGAPGSQILVVEWTGNLNSDSAASVRFQAMLYEATGAVEFHYCAMSTTGTTTNFSGLGATIGIENATGTQGARLSYNTGGAATTGTGYRIP